MKKRPTPSTSKKKPQRKKTASAQIPAATVRKCLTAIDLALREMDLIEPDQTPLNRFTVEARWVDAPTIQKLNKKYRKKNVVTDILSFPAPRVFAEKGHLGELVLCREQTAQQAKEQGHSLLLETQILIVHGILHLTGLDHEQTKTAAGREQAELMRAIEVAVLGDKGLIERS
jgi:rRNA maturation RNase YbeY